jgi:FtsH-binding integral membrane protein
MTRWTWYIGFGFLGMLIAGVLNLFLFRSPTLDLLISIGGVVLFSGSTAWTVQRLDRTTHELPPTLHSRAALIGGAMLYTNFINLFMRLLAIYARTQKK